MGVGRTTRRALEGQRGRMERTLSEPPISPRTSRGPFLPDSETLLEIREQTLIDLVLINVFILVVSGVAGYLLAGLTLKPIEVMVRKQKRFVSDAAHEMRTPLTAMKTDLEVTLRDKDLTPETSKKALRNTVEEVDKLHQLTDKLLTQSKYQNNQNLKLEALELNQIIENVKHKLSPLARKKDEKFKLDLDKVKVFGNEEELKELFTNLIENAIKYSKHSGEVAVSLRKIDQSAVVTIEDHGQGIEKDDIPYIFEPFYRTDKSRTKSDQHGYGLGLAIAKEIVERHRGKIIVESEKDAGTKITVTLPLSKFSESNSNV